ncbi:MAG: hypothetical protein GF331_21190 [Chitinivibrionales bacterium]|nr:hypothetical protein [Chitinivibrionales bacterium]
MTHSEIAAEVMRSATERDGKRILACARALALAERLGVTPREVGTICDENGIRIAHCQLGCFG